MSNVNNTDKVQGFQQVIVSTAMELNEIVALGSKNISDINMASVPPITKEIKVFTNSMDKLIHAYTVAEKISDFVLEYGIRVFIATGAVLFGILQLATLNIPVGTVALGLGLAQIAEIAYNYSNNSNLDLAFDAIKQDANKIQEIGAKNKEVINDIQSKIEASTKLVNQLQVSVDSVESDAAEIRTEISNLQNEIKELNDQKAFALKHFEESKQLANKATESFAESGILVTNLLLINDSQTKDKIIAMVQETAGKIQDSHNKGFDYYVKSQTALDKGTAILTSSSTANATIEGKINLLKVKAETIAENARIEKENLAKLANKQKEIVELSVELKNNQAKVEEITHDMNGRIDDAKKTANSEIRKNNMLTTAGAVIGYGTGCGAMGVIAGAYVVPKVLSALIPNNENKVVEQKTVKLNSTQQIMLLALRQKMIQDTKNQESEIYKKTFQVIIGDDSNEDANLDIATGINGC